MVSALSVQQPQRALRLGDRLVQLRLAGLDSDEVGQNDDQTHILIYTVSVWVFFCLFVFFIKFLLTLIGFWCVRNLMFFYDFIQYIKINNRFCIIV